MVSPSEAQTKRGEKVRRESEHLIVPLKSGNPSRGDPVEGRRCRVAEPLEGNMAGAQQPDPVFTKCQRIAELAQQQPQLGFTSLNHHLDLIWLVTAYNRTRKDGAPGVDGQTADDYGLALLDNLESLLERAKSGTYWAPLVRRVRIPKGTGPETRPLGIPTLEDKILQRAVVMALEPIYEQDFLNCSYGFRPGRSAHQALAALWQQVMDLGGCWLVEVDIRKFFDTLDHARLRELLRQRVRDGVLLRLIDKWLSAGVLEGVELTYPDAGTPQGGVISPLLANGYLHYVLDVWFEAAKKGNWVVKRKTADSRFHRAVKKIAEWCRLNRHRPMREQYETLTRKLQGHYQSYGVIGNLASLHRFYYEVVCLWRKWLSRRKRRGQLTWERYFGLLRVFVLPWPHAQAYPHAVNP